jgi:adenylate cyclase class 2
MIEYEVKILDIDVAEITKNLSEIGYTPQRKRSFRRIIFDTIPEDKNKWVRLRTDGFITTLTYKEYLRDSIDGVKEIEVEVDNFENCRSLLESSGLRSRSYQENSRTDFINKSMSAEISIDEWPNIPPYLEIESKSVGDVEKMVSDLKLESHEKTSETTANVYKRYGLTLE